MIPPRLRLARAGAAVAVMCTLLAAGCSSEDADRDAESNGADSANRTAPAAPTGATESEFCAALNSDPSRSEATPELLAEYADTLKDTGTPDGIPADARAGFESTVDQFSKADDAFVARYQEGSDPSEVLAEGNPDDIAAFVAYVVSVCSAER